MVCLSSEGEVVRPALLWNDTRSAGAAADLVAELGAAAWAEGCGARPDRTCSPVVASRMTTVQDCVDESTPATRLMVAKVVPG